MGIGSLSGDPERRGGASAALSRDRVATLELAPIGVPLVVTCRDPDVLAEVAAVITGWNAPSHPSARSLRLDIEVTPRHEEHDETPTLDADRNRLLLRGPGVAGWADAGRGLATCALSERRLASRAIDDAIEPLVLYLLSRRDRTPIHASSFISDGLAIVLVGRSGTGKSCLALAAHHAGYPVLSDDTVYVQRDPQPIIWGIPQPIHVFGHDAPVDARAVVRLRNGKLKCPIDLAASHPLRARRMVLCLLVPGTAPGLELLNPHEARSALPPLEPGFDLLEPETRATLDLLTSKGAARLTLGADPNAAIALLERYWPALRALALP